VVGGVEKLRILGMNKSFIREGGNIGSEGAVDELTISGDR